MDIRENLRDLASKPEAPLRVSYYFLNHWLSNPDEAASQFKEVLTYEQRVYIIPMFSYAYLSYDDTPRHSINQEEADRRITLLRKYFDDEIQESRRRSWATYNKMAYPIPRY
jgi:hypothetical protein